ncbi:T9SS type A sorting domain-containing protein [bacterium SCSIO 12741]|nr:T9SS type A sorting domain-containing protein [bacterium SCSIO 12741]
MGKFFVDPETNSLYHTGEYSLSGSSLRVGLVRWTNGQFQVLDSSRTYLNRSNYSTSMLRYQNELYVCGSFSYMGDTNSVQKSFCKLGDTGFKETSQALKRNYNIQTMTEYDGQLLLAGRFDSLDHLSCRSIAAWNGQEFSDFPVLEASENGLTEITSLIEYKGLLYAGGFFGDSPTNRDLQVFDGTSWKSIDGWSVGTSSGWVNDMVVYKDELYIAGGFSKSDGKGIANRVVKYDGQYFYELGNGLDNTVYDLEVHNGSLFMFGGFESANGMSASKIAVWKDDHFYTFSSDSIDQWISDAVFYEDSLLITGSFQQIGSSGPGQSVAYQAKWAGKFQPLQSQATEVNRVGNYTTQVEPQLESQKPLRAYPNPFTGEVTLESQTPGWYSLFDHQGRLVWSGALDSPTETIDLHHLDPGSYQMVDETGHAVSLIKN